MKDGLAPTKFDTIGSKGIHCTSRPRPRQARIVEAGQCASSCRGKERVSRAFLCMFIRFPLGNLKLQQPQLFRSKPDEQPTERLTARARPPKSESARIPMNRECWFALPE